MHNQNDFQTKNLKRFILNELRSNIKKLKLSTPTQRMLFHNPQTRQAAVVDPVEPLKLMNEDQIVPRFLTPVTLAFLNNPEGGVYSCAVVRLPKRLLTGKGLLAGLKLSPLLGEGGGPARERFCYLPLPPTQLAFQVGTMNFFKFPTYQVCQEEEGRRMGFHVPNKPSLRSRSWTIARPWMQIFFRCYQLTSIK